MRNRGSQRREKAKDRSLLADTAESKRAGSGYLIPVTALCIAVITFLIYLPALQHDFINWDDDVYVYANENIRSIDADLLRWIFSLEANPTWHPLTLFSFAVDYHFWKLDPRGYHLSNIIIHIFNTFIVFVLASRLTRAGLRSGQSPYIQFIAGAVTSILFGLHPLHVESVAWVSERKDVLYAFFFLLSITAYLSFAESNNSRKVYYYWVSLMLFVLSLMAKPMAVTLPFVLIIIDFYPLRRLSRRNLVSVLAEKIPFVIFSIFSGILNIMTQNYGGALKSLESHPPLVRLYSVFSGYIFYLKKMIVPSGLGPFYPFSEDISFFSNSFLIPAAIITGISVLSIFLYKRDRPALTAAWGYYIITILPVSGIMQVGEHAGADRYTYLPSLGPFLMAGIGMALLFDKYRSHAARTLFTLCSILVCVLLIRQTGKQIAIWKDPVSLWTHEINLFPYTAPVAYNNRGNAFTRLARYEDAIKDLTNAINMKPLDSVAYYNRGNAYSRLGNDVSAIHDFTRAVELEPGMGMSYYNRGNAYYRMSKFAEAIGDYSEVISMKPDYADAYINRGNAYSSMREFNRAVEDYNAAIRFRDDDPTAFINRGNVYHAMGLYKEAIDNYNTAIHLDPMNPTAYMNRGNTYNVSGNIERAKSDFESALKLNPNLQN